MKILSFICFFSLGLVNINAQNYVDTLFQISTTYHVNYGEVIDVAGNSRTLSMDISQPIGDTIPACGRPLLVMIHGGAFIAGSKEDFHTIKIREDFAKRGYTTATINYRLGQFQTDLNVNCNVSELGLNWNCLNMQDTIEWYRAYYRGIQDGKGAVRYLVNHAESYNINPQNIFVAGESAGGFIAMGVGFLDDMSEVLSPLISGIPDASAPNTIYENECVIGFGLDTSIAQMDLERGDLGNYEGILNYPANSNYTIQAVGNFFGGTFNNIFHSSTSHIPGLYLYHQPNDLIVPFNTSKVFAGFSNCATQFPFFCQQIINRPLCHGSNGIKKMLEDMEMNGDAIPDYLFDPSNNTANCALQILNPSLSGHAYDNYWLRSNNMAIFFLSHVDNCSISKNIVEPLEEKILQLFPNPIQPNGKFQMLFPFLADDEIRIVDIRGKSIFTMPVEHSSSLIEIKVPELNMESGIYFVQVHSQTGKYTQKLVIQ